MAGTFRAHTWSRPENPLNPALEVHRAAPTVGASLAALIAERARRADGFARCCVIVLSHGSQRAELAATLARIPSELVPLLAEIAVLCEDAASEADARAVLEAEPARWSDARVLQNPRRYGYGGRRKVAFEYALAQRFDHVVLLEADGSYAPERLADLLARAVIEGQAVVVASRARRSLAATLHNRMLGMRVRDWSSGYRILATEVLRQIPFQLDSDDRRFDTQLLIQCRALGAPIAELSVEPASVRDGPRDKFSLVRSLGSAIDYRLHQVHWSRRGRYLVDENVHYTFKKSRTGSHMQIVDAIRPHSRVLDLGCSQGLLAKPLAEKDVRVTGVDTHTEHAVSPHLEAYHRRDLETPFELEEGRVFDYVVVSDVIEHVMNRMQLLRSVRRYLKPDGRLLISTPNIAIWFYRLSLVVGRFEYGPRGVLDETHVHLFTRASFRREVERGGFRVLSERVTALPFEVVFQSTGKSRFVRAVSQLYHWAARAWPEMFAYQFLLEAEVTTLLDGDARRSARGPVRE